MNSLTERIGIGALLAVAAGCAAKPLQGPDGGGSGGIGPIGRDGGATDLAGLGDIGGATDLGGLGDTGGATDTGGTLFTGRRSFVVMSTVTPLGSGEGGGVTSHSFTMVVDGDHLTAISGASGSITVSPVQPSAGGFRIVGSLVFADAGSPRCGGSLTYEDLSFTFDPAGRILGSARGALATIVGDVGNIASVTMSMTGVADTVSPVLTLVSYADVTNPFTSFSVVPSEPLPARTQPVLRSASGDAVILSPSTTSGGEAFVEFFGPPVVLRFGEQYHVDLGVGMADFAGNAAIGGNLTFTTRAAPPLIAADGFESVTGATLGGGEVLSGAGDPVISGTRSLYVSPGSAPATAPAIQLALRLGVVPGSTVLRFAYRLVNPAAVTNAYFSIGSVGGTIAQIAPPPGGTGTTTATIAGKQVTLGPVATAMIALPAGTTDEIVVERGTAGSACGPPYPLAGGIIIDDLRTE